GWGGWGSDGGGGPRAAAARRLGFQLGEPPLELAWAERRILVVHDPRDLDAALRAEHTLALHGHTHRRVAERRDSCLVFNPGECAGHMAGHNAVGVVDLRRMTTEILSF